MSEAKPKQNQYELGSGCRCLNPECGRTLVAGIEIEEGRTDPKPNEVTICGHCGHLMAFAEGGGMRELTESELVDVAGSAELIRAQEFARSLRDVLETMKE